ncbi:MAG TPA: DNA repair protein RecN [Vicinamibacteria bacterium]|nr:DNA repair protein RecN [Vicinamibacteria bacterium]
MLKLLRISNIALIPSLDLDFDPGLTLLTGETGAGKSILIDALGLLLGLRASSELIRTGEERAWVEAVIEGEGLGRFLQDHGLPGDGDEAVVRREVLASGKGRASINGALVPIAVLRDLGPLVATIHGQHEPQGLLDAETHLALLDRHAGLSEEAGRVADAYRRLRSAESALETLRRDRRELERRREMLEFQAGEIEKAALLPGEEESLRQEKLVQANRGRLADLSAEAYAILFEDEGAVLTRLGQAYRRIEDLAGIDPRFLSHLEARQAVGAQLDDLALFLRDYREALEVSPGRLDEIESRLALIERLKRKYGASVEEVIAFGDACRGQLGELGSPEEQERTVDQERAGAESAFLEAARGLSGRRRAAARDLEKKVQQELALLAMEKTRFKVAFSPEAPGGREAWSERGLESAEFLLSPNPGEELRPLARIASGGELSRILLALNSAAQLARSGRTLIFDEVDAGIGGRVAEVVGRKLRAMAAEHQVLCVTHLPQIACFADSHYAVRKRVEKGRTFTSVEGLGEAERVDEIARMLGGATLTEAAREHARDMMKQSLKS